MNRVDGEKELERYFENDEAYAEADKQYQAGLQGAPVPYMQKGEEYYTEELNLRSYSDFVALKRMQATLISKSVQKLRTKSKSTQRQSSTTPSDKVEQDEVRDKVKEYEFILDAVRQKVSADFARQYARAVCVKG